MRQKRVSLSPAVLATLQIEAASGQPLSDLSGRYGVSPSRIGSLISPWAQADAKGLWVDYLAGIPLAELAARYAGISVPAVRRRIWRYVCPQKTAITLDQRLELWHPSIRQLSILMRFLTERPTVAELARPWQYSLDSIRSILKMGGFHIEIPPDPQAQFTIQAAITERLRLSLDRRNIRLAESLKEVAHPEGCPQIPFIKTLPPAQQIQLRSWITDYGPSQGKWLYRFYRGRELAKLKQIPWSISLYEWVSLWVKSSAIIEGDMDWVSFELTRIDPTQGFDGGNVSIQRRASLPALPKPQQLPPLPDRPKLLFPFTVEHGCVLMAMLTPLCTEIIALPPQKPKAGARGQ